MENIYLKRFLSLGITYREFGVTLGVERAAAHVFVNRPERSTLNQSLKVGTALGFSEEEIRKFWTDIKPAYAIEKIKSNL